MTFDPDAILSILDRCCDAFTFPMMDNGSIYLAAARLSLYRSRIDWAMVIEVFGFSPRLTAGGRDACRVGDPRYPSPVHGASRSSA
jgi:hypothetical protein